MPKTRSARPPCKAGLPAHAQKLVYEDDAAGIPSNLPDVETAALPGTPSKVERMAERVAAGKSPFHPDDLRVGDCLHLGLVCALDHSNGAAAWIEGGRGERRAASTALHGVADEREFQAELERAREELKAQRAGG